MKTRKERTSDIPSFVEELAKTSTELSKQLGQLLEKEKYEEARAISAKLSMLNEIIDFAPQGMYRKYLDIKFPIH